MAARIDRLHSERVRNRIKLSQLVTRLENNSLGKITMSPGQIDTAKFLVARVMAPPPEEKDLKVSGSLTVEIVKFSADDSPAK